MRYGKTYGQSAVSSCPFCGDAAYQKNAQGVPVCRLHTSKALPDLKCVCGGWLDQRESKFGVFYTCMKCGPVSFSRMMEVNGQKIRDSLQPPPKAPTYNAPAKPRTIKDVVREKVKRGEPLTPDELDFL